MNKLGQESAFASNYDEHIGFDSLGNKEFVRINEIGISKRLYIATAAMQGLLAGKYYNTLVNSPTNRVEDGFPEPISICEEAYVFADEILKQELEEIDE